MLTKRRERLLAMQRAMHAQAYRQVASKRGAIAVLVGCGAVGTIIGIMAGMYGVCP